MRSATLFVTLAKLPPIPRDPKMSLFLCVERVVVCLRHSRRFSALCSTCRTEVSDLSVSSHVVHRPVLATSSAKRIDMFMAARRRTAGVCVVESSQFLHL